MIKFRLVSLISLGFIVIPLCLIIVISVYFSLQSIEENNKQSENIAKRNAINISERIDRNLYERYGDVQAFSLNKLAQEACINSSYKADLREFMNSMITNYVLYDLMMVVDLNGNVIAYNTIDKSANGINTSILDSNNYASQIWFKKAFEVTQGNAYYSDFTINEDVKKIYRSDGHGMSFSAPIRDKDRKIIGVWFNYANWHDIVTSLSKEVMNNFQSDQQKPLLFITKTDKTIIEAAKPELIGTFFDPKSENLKSLNNDLADEFMKSTTISSGAYSYKGNNWNYHFFMPKIKLSITNLVPIDILLIDLIILSVAILLSYYFSKLIKEKINSVIVPIEKLASGELPTTKTTVDNVAEIARIEASITILIESYQNTIHFAEQIGKGNFDITYKELGKQDDMGKALVYMQESLRKANAKEIEQKWVAEGVAMITKSITSYKELESFTDNILKDTIKYVGATMGALYIKESDYSEKEKLELKSCYAFNRKKFISTTLLPGEGIVGLAYLEQDKVYMTDVPKEYYKITSGLGEALPKCIIALPLISNETVVGVLEIASMNPFSKNELLFLENITERIASHISNILASENTKKLLEEAIAQREILHSQEEELKQNLEEMLSTQESYERKERELLAQIEEIKNELVDLKTFTK